VGKNLFLQDKTSKKVILLEEIRPNFFGLGTTHHIKPNELRVQKKLYPVGTGCKNIYKGALLARNWAGCSKSKVVLPRLRRLDMKPDIKPKGT
jgi:hypothetical protein